MLTRNPWIVATVTCLALVLMATCALAQDEFQPADEGLVQVTSRRDAAVYRSPDVSFAQYRRLMFDRVSVTFKAGFRRNHPKLTEEDVERLRSRAAAQFQDELERELAERGKFPVAEEPAPDVLRVKAMLTSFEPNAPNAGRTPGERAYARSAISSMVLMVELYDAASGVLVGRILDLTTPMEYQRPQRIDQVVLEDESRRAFKHAAQLVRDAINVAMTERR
jgi:hypothetical protein